MSARKDGAMLFVQHLRDWCSDRVAFFTNRWIGIEKPFDVGNHIHLRFRNYLCA